VGSGRGKGSLFTSYRTRADGAHGLYLFSAAEGGAEAGGGERGREFKDGSARAMGERMDSPLWLCEKWIGEGWSGGMWVWRRSTALTVWGSGLGNGWGMRVDGRG